MTKVYTGATMSLDGYISGPGERRVRTPLPVVRQRRRRDAGRRPRHDAGTSAASAKHLRALNERTGALVVGRRLFDMTNGWGGRHPMEYPWWCSRTVCRRAGARERLVHVRHRRHRAGDRAGEGDRRRQAGRRQRRHDRRQCIEAGLLDEVWVDLAPVLLGGGTPFFDGLKIAPITLHGPLRVVEGKASPTYALSGRLSVSLPIRRDSRWLRSGAS